MLMVLCVFDVVCFWCFVFMVWYSFRFVCFWCCVFVVLCVHGVACL